jgi:hypothetical protein
MWAYKPIVRSPSTLKCHYQLRQHEQCSNALAAALPLHAYFNESINYVQRQNYLPDIAINLETPRKFICRKPRGKFWHFQTSIVFNCICCYRDMCRSIRLDRRAKCRNLVRTNITKQTKADQHHVLTPRYHYVSTYGIVFKIKLHIDFTHTLWSHTLNDKMDGKEQRTRGHYKIILLYKGVQQDSTALLSIKYASINYRHKRRHPWHGIVQCSSWFDAIFSSTYSSQT